VSDGRVGVVLLNFGEPENPTLDEVTPFLERIFQANAPLERTTVEASRGARSRELAAARAPVLVETYRVIGGSPLNAQSREQATALESELRRRGVDAVCRSAFQFTAPSPDDVVRQLLPMDLAALVALPVYPLCGPSTTVAALASLDHAARASGWEGGVLELGGWHLHPDYLAFHADHVRESCRSWGVDARDPRTALLFSIHGTPVRYLEGGSRYDRYVEEACAGIARGLGVQRYHVGYQNHTNRPIEWTKPDVEAVLDEIDADRVVVVAASFMHEQSETLSELDHDLRRAAEKRGLAFHRVPIPHVHPRFVRVLADLVEARMGRDPAGSAVTLRRCVCRAGGAARCTNGLRGEGTVAL
jgi:ferrochelatase